MKQVPEFPLGDPYDCHCSRVAELEAMLTANLVRTMREEA